MSKPRLPADVRQLLLAQPGPLCTSLLINEQAAIVVKAPRATCEGLRGPIPIGYRPEAGFYPSGAVIRLVLDFFDKPDDPLGLDTFLNVASADHLQLLRVLQAQPAIIVHLFDDAAIEYQYSKQISHRPGSRSELGDLIDLAILHDKALERIDFDAAKAAMMLERPL